jgi:hypothetical protein
MDSGKKEMSDEKMKMWKMRKELLDSMSEKELRAFITGYMMAESKKRHESGCGCGSSCGCGGGGCSCGCDSSCGCGSGCSCACCSSDKK